MTTNAIKTLIQNISHIYIHVPFCDGKCNYCSFYSIKKTSYNTKLYLNALKTEIVKSSENKKIAPSTIYVGGGSPSVLDSPKLKQFLKIIGDHFDLSNLKEWTFEANPSSVSHQKLHLLKEHGVNRISIGIQSFSDKTLAKLGRRYNSSKARTAIQTIKEFTENFNIDLIAAVPGTNDREWENDLSEAINHYPSHMSVYTLSIEEGSLIQKMAENGKWQKENEMTEIKRINAAQKFLAKHGFQRYEISNYARRNRECLHNCAFWEGKDYLGFGPSAVSRIQNLRLTNPSSLDKWAKMTREPSFSQEIETLSHDKDLAERMGFSFRLLKKPACPSFFAIENKILLNSWNKIINDLILQKLIKKKNNGFVLTKRGINFADYVASKFINNAE